MNININNANYSNNIIKTITSDNLVEDFRIKFNTSQQISIDNKCHEGFIYLKDKIKQIDEISILDFLINKKSDLLRIVDPQRPIEEKAFNTEWKALELKVQERLNILELKSIIDKIERLKSANNNFIPSLITILKELKEISNKIGLTDYPMDADSVEGDWGRRESAKRVVYQNQLLEIKHKFEELAGTVYSLKLTPTELNTVKEYYDYIQPIIDLPEGDMKMDVSDDLQTAKKAQENMDWESAIVLNQALNQQINHHVQGQRNLAQKRKREDNDVTRNPKKQKFEVIKQTNSNSLAMVPMEIDFISPLQLFDTLSLITSRFPLKDFSKLALVSKTFYKSLMHNWLTDNFIKFIPTIPENRKFSYFKGNYEPMRAIDVTFQSQYSWPWGSDKNTYLDMTVRDDRSEISYSSVKIKWDIGKIIMPIKEKIPLYIKELINVSNEDDKSKLLQKWKLDKRLERYSWISGSFIIEDSLALINGKKAYFWRKDVSGPVTISYELDPEAFKLEPTTQKFTVEYKKSF